jgi:hypothetical protein
MCGGNGVLSRDPDDDTGRITSNDEIKFTRQVAEVVTEEIVATRVK